MAGTEQTTTWLTTPKIVGLAVGGAILVGGAIYIASNWKVKKTPQRRTTTRQEPQEDTTPSFKKFRDDLKDVDKRNETLDLIYESTRYHETHDHFRTSGCLDVLLRLFSEHNQDEGVVFRLIRVLANLATNKENRLVIGESHAIEDMIYYLDARWNGEIREDVLRGLMNLSIAPENEELVREKGALDVLLELYKSEQLDSKILLHTSRVLVNLACNATNRKLMAKEHAIERTIEILQQSDDIDLLPRVVRLYGTFAIDCSDTSYMLLADTKNATRLAVLIKNQLALGEAKHTSLCEIILYAIARTVSVAEKKSTLTEQVQAFATVFGQPLSDDSSATPASMIASLATPALEGSFSSTTSTQNESLFVAVATSLKQVASASDKVKEALRGDSEAFSKIKLLQLSDNANLARAARELYELVLPPITAVDELD